MQISQVMTSYTEPNLIKRDLKGYLSQFESEMFHFLQYDLYVICRLGGPYSEKL